MNCPATYKSMSCIENIHQEYIYGNYVNKAEITETSIKTANFSWIAKEF